jgi:hypothetical protein
VRTVVGIALVAGALAVTPPLGARASADLQNVARGRSPSNAELPANGIPWSPKRLTWDDYRGHQPPGAAEAAVTATSLEWGFQCVGDAFTFHVQADFYPDRSWVNPMIFAQLDSNLRTLRHEQLHFDVTEVYARRMRQTYATLDRPCARTEDELSELGERSLKDEANAQKRYDRETANGRDNQGQSRWERQIGETLRNLAVFGKLPQS